MRGVYWLVNGVTGMVADLIMFASLNKSGTVFVSAMLKDVDYLPMAKPVCNYPLGDTP